MEKSPRVSFKQINKLAIPLIIAGISEPLLSLVDTAVVGNVDTHAIEALAAVGIAGSFIAAIVWVLGQTRASISSIVAHYVGAQKLADIRSLPAQTIGINVALSFLLCIVTVLFTKQIFQMYNAEGLVLDYAVRYCEIRALGLPFSLFVFTVFGVFTGLQNTFWPMIISIVGAILNIGLDVLLVYGWDGVVPAMHVEGAAYASVIAQMAMAVLALGLFVKKTPFSLRIRLPFNPELKRLVALSVNLFVRATALHVTLYLANSYATFYGKEMIAAQTICFQIWLFFAFFIDGYASVGSIISGKQKGAGQYNALVVLVRDLSKYGISVAVILMGICFVFYRQIGGLFTSDSFVLDVFYGVFWMVLVAQPLNAIAFVYDGIFKGLAAGVALRNTLLLATFAGFVPTLLLCDYFGFQLRGIWMAFTVWMAARSGILYWKFRKQYRQAS